jgi:hypothetical protein
LLLYWAASVGSKPKRGASTRSSVSASVIAGPLNVKSASERLCVVYSFRRFSGDPGCAVRSMLPRARRGGRRKRPSLSTKR